MQNKNYYLQQYFKYYFIKNRNGFENKYNKLDEENTSKKYCCYIL